VRSGNVIPGFPRPRLATKLTQSPWFLNRGLVKLRQPPFLHCSIEVGGSPAAEVGVLVGVFV
jgi:hypothetical protein